MGERLNFKSIFKPKAQSLKPKTFDFLAGLTNYLTHCIYMR